MKSPSGNNHTNGLTDSPGGFRLGDYRIHPDQRLVIASSGEAVKLENRVMSVLLELARHPHQTLSEDHFMETVWADRVVTPQVLSRSISLARSALGDSAEKSEYIRTVPQEGYRLVVDVRPLGDRRRRITWGLAASVAVLMLAAASVVTFWRSEEAPVKVAVIPFTAPELSQLPVGGESLADFLISALSDAEGIQLVSRLDAFAIDRARMDTRSIGDALGADYLISGGISEQAGRVYLTLTLTDADAAAELWSERIDAMQEQAGSGNPGLIEQQALASLSEALHRELGIPALKASSRPARTSDLAYRKYLQAAFQWHLRGARRLDAAIQLNREAIELSPDFPEAHLALAQALAVKPFYTDEPIGTYFAEAEFALSEVKRLTDALDAEVDALRGFMSMEEKRWADARTHLERALARNPGSALAHYWYSNLLSIFGSHHKALAEVQTAVALNPNSAVLNDRLALAYLWVDDLAGAQARYDIAIELGYLESTQVKPAVLLAVRSANWQQIRRLLVQLGNSPRWVDAFVDALIDPATRNQAAEVIEAAMTEGDVDRAFWFGIWVLLGDADRAFRDFDAGEKTQDIELLWAREAAFLREDPRFPALMAQLGLTPFVHDPAAASLSSGG